MLHIYISNILLRFTESKVCVKHSNTSLILCRIFLKFRSIKENRRINKSNQCSTIFKSYKVSFRRQIGIYASTEKYWGNHGLNNHRGKYQDKMP